MDPKRMSRRRFVASCAAMATGLVAAACAPKLVEKVVKETVVKEVEKVVKETVVVEGAPVEVTRIVKETVVVEVEKAPPAEEIVEITVARSEHPAQPIIQDAPAHLAITEHTGVKLHFVTMDTDDYDAKRKVWLATNQVPDLMRASGGDIRDYAGEGVILPYMPLINKYAPNLKRYIDTYPDIAKMKIDGKLYFVPHQYFNRKVCASVPMIRKDILDGLGLETPTNFDELYEVLKAFKEAYPDSLVWTNRNGTARLLSLNAYPMGSGWQVYWDKDVEGGKWLFGPIHPEFRDVLGYFARAYADGILDPDFAVTKADQWHEKNSSGKGLYCWENITFGVRWNLALRETNPDVGWGPMYVLEGTKGKRMTTYGGLQGGYVIGANTKYPERIIKMLDWMITPLGLDTTNFGIEGVHYNYVKGTRPEIIEDYTMAGLAKAMDPSKKEIVPEVYKRFGETRDPFRSYQSETGTGLLDFNVLTDSTMEYPWDPPGETDEWYELTGSDPGLHGNFLTPPFTAEERERIKEVTTNVGSILDPAYDKVIIGQMSLDDYDQAVKQAIEAGAEEMEEIYNEAEARLK